MADQRREGDMPPPNRPTVRQLEYALAVADHLHFRRAAEACGVTQPALSAQIQALEELLGARLFERDRRQVLLTDVGRQVVARARDVLDQVDGLFTAVASAREPLVGPLRLGVIPTIAPYLLPRVIPGLRERFPLLRLYLREEFTHLLLERLASGELDAALLALPVAGEFECQLLFNDDFHVALPPDHPLSKRKRLKEEDLTDQDVLLLEDGHCLRDQALALCGSAGAVENLQVRATSLGTLTQMVAGGLGLTLLPELALEVEAERATGIQVRPFTHPRPHREVGLVWRRASGRSDELRLFGETLVELLDAPA